MSELTPRQIVAELDRYIIGQDAAKRAVAIAVRNRWRRQRVEADMKNEIGPKNMMMIGPTGVGKTEIARRLATLSGAPFIKVEATKYTEVGYYGRDVESMVRELVENAIGMVRTRERERIEIEATAATEERLLELLAEALRPQDTDPSSAKNDSNLTATDAESGTSGGADTSDGINIPPGIFSFPPELAEQIEKNPNFPLPGFATFVKNFHGKLSPSGPFDPVRTEANSPHVAETPLGDNAPLADAPNRQETVEPPYILDREELRRRLRAGDYDTTLVLITAEQKLPSVMIGGIGMESMENDLQNMFETILPKKSQRRELPVAEAKNVLFEQEVERRIDRDTVNAQGVELAEHLGIIFIDEIDKIVASERQHGADVSRQGVQRDLLPIVEGTTIQTKYGFVSTEHILFIAAGAFHRAKPSDLMPELQGRFPIRVELSDLGEEDLVRILTEPHSALTKQYSALMQTEGVELIFEPDAILSLANYAHEVNQTSQNIGARRLATIMERLLEELSFEAPEMTMGRVVVNAAYVTARLEKIATDEELNKFIL